MLRFANSGPKTFYSPTMVGREHRVRDMTNFSRRTDRDLARDRMFLEQRERKLLNDVKRLVHKNDIHNARLVATQIAVYRRLVERNYESAVIIATKLQTVSSNHKINRAEVETIKGMKHANKGRTAQSVEAHEWKYDQRMKSYESMEEIMTEGMDDVYHDVPLLFASDDQPRYTVQQMVVDSIMKQAITDSSHVREYFEYDTEPSRRRIQLSLKVVGNRYASASLSVDTLELSVDMLKRCLIKDGHVLEQLELTDASPQRFEFLPRNVRPFSLGRLKGARGGDGNGEGEIGGDEGSDDDSTSESAFRAFPHAESLKNLGIRNGETIWVHPK